MSSIKKKILSLFNLNVKQVNIAKQLGTSRSYVSKVLKRHKQKRNGALRVKRGRPVSVTTKYNIKRVKQMITRNPMLSTRQIGKRLNISKETSRKILKSELKVKPYKMVHRQLLSNVNKQKRLERCLFFKKRFKLEQNRSILFTDEKLFTVSQVSNRQNTRVWTKDKNDSRRLVSHVQKPASVMVWAGICRTGKTPLFFIEEGVKVNQFVYKNLLDKKVLPWAKKHFKNEKWTFQQDSAPAHKAKSVIKYLAENVPDFIDPSSWPPSSPDLNPMDFSLWGILEENACKKPHKSVASLKRSLVREWNKIDVETLKKASNDFYNRVLKCIKAKGGHFE